MDDESKPAERQEVGAIAHKAAASPFDPSLEPLLRDNPRRFVIFPIVYEDIWKMYKKASEVVINSGQISSLSAKSKHF